MVHRRPFFLGAGLALGAQLLTGCGVAARRLDRAPNDAPAGSTAARSADADATLDGYFTDASRQRDIPWRLRLPAGDGPVAWVIFSHGLGGGLAAGTLWAQAWAQAGIATLHLQHQGSDTDVWRGGEAMLRQAASGQQLVQRALDVRAAMDQVQRLAAAAGGTGGAAAGATNDAGRTAWHRLRIDALGLAGHSFGAHTTMAVAGQRYFSPAGAATGVSLADPRPRAFAAFSPSPTAGSTPALSFGAIARPMLCLTGSVDTDPLAQADAERARRGDYRRAVFDGLPAGDKAELWLDGADHMTFGGQQVDVLPARLARRPTSAREQAQRHNGLIMAASTLWWRAQLLGDMAARQALAAGPAGLMAADAWRRG